jgi:hypothetical protein
VSCQRDVPKSSKLPAAVNAHGGRALQHITNIGLRVPFALATSRTCFPCTGTKDTIMNTRSTLVAAALLTAAAVPASGQTASLAAGPANGGAQGAASIPDFSGIWARVSFPGFAPPLTGAGPVTNKLRSRNGAASVYGLVGDYTNPILKPRRQRS